MDMYQLIQYMVGNMSLTDVQQKASDTSRDGKADSMDLYQIIQYSIGNNVIKI